jgi:hypothetical protein
MSSSLTWSLQNWQMRRSQVVPSGITKSQSATLVRFRQSWHFLRRGRSRQIITPPKSKQSLLGTRVLKQFRVDQFCATRFAFVGSTSDDTPCAFALVFSELIVLRMR